MFITKVLLLKKPMLEGFTLIGPALEIPFETHSRSLKRKIVEQEVERARPLTAIASFPKPEFPDNSLACSFLWTSPPAGDTAQI